MTSPDLSAMLHRAREATGLDLELGGGTGTGRWVNLRFQDYDERISVDGTRSGCHAFLAGMIACAEWTKRAGKEE
jgi:hypothetical protein